MRTGTADDGPHSWPHRCGAVTHVLRALAPDLLGVQECLDFQVNYLRRELPGHDFVGVGRNDGDRVSEFAAILYRRDHLDLVDVRHM
ncbi:MAG: hypothetical protein WD042_05450 [Phycisphaeraceae bacterium]